MSKAKNNIKSDIEANWKKARNFTPKSNEIIIYEPDDKVNYYRVKVGNGFNNVNDLPFVTADEPQWKEF